MRRAQWAALAGAALLLGAAFLVRDARDQPAPSGEPALERLREAAALQSCPEGLGPELPALVLPCLGGGPAVDLRAAAPGRPTLVNVWATWCPP